MSEDQLKSIGEYVVWLEKNGNNLQQSLAQSIIVRGLVEWNEKRNLKTESEDV